MDETVLLEELERTVHGGRGAPAPVLGQLLEDGVGSEGLVALPHDLEHPAPQGGEPRLVGGAHRLGVAERGLDAVLVVVARTEECGIGEAGGARAGRSGHGWLSLPVATGVIITRGTADCLRQGELHLVDTER